MVPDCSKICRGFKLSQDYGIMPTLYWFTSIVNANFSVNPISPISKIQLVGIINAAFWLVELVLGYML